MSGAAGDGSGLADDPVALLALLHSAADIITVVDADKRLRFISDGYRRVLGYESVPDTVPAFCIHPDDVATVVHQVEAHVAGTAGAAIEYRVQHADGTWRWMEGTTTNLLDDPHIQGVVTVTRDITDRKLAEEKVRHLTSHDPLTDLPNRLLIAERLEEILPTVRIGTPTAAVLLVDIDGFAGVNDLLGYAGGDDVLRILADRLRSVSGSADMVARYGGDEFAIAHAPTPGFSTAQLVEEVERTVAAPLAVGGRQLRLSATVGVCEIEHSQISPHQALALAVADTYDRKWRRRDA